jgi:hypothetical protein
MHMYSSVDRFSARSIRTGNGLATNPQTQFNGTDNEIIWTHVPKRLSLHISFLLVTLHVWPGLLIPGSLDQSYL